MYVCAGVWHRDLGFNGGNGKMFVILAKLIYVDPARIPDPAAFSSATSMS